MMREDEAIARERAKTLRRTLSAAEVRVWRHLKGAAFGAKFRRQHPIGPFIADFACVERRLVVEIDGAEHFTADGMRWDARRTACLQAEGWRVLRVTNGDVFENLDGVLIAIRAALDVKR